MATIAVRPPTGSGDGNLESLPAQIRAYTRANHERAEAVLDLPDRLASPADLVSLLRAWLLVWREVCRECGPGDPGERGVLGQTGQDALGAVTADLTDLLHLTRRYATPQDLADLVAPDRDLHPRLVLTTLLDTHAGVWAVSYVLRGSRLGSRVLAPQIAERLNLPAGTALRYHAGADETRAWPAFRRRMDTWGRGASSEDAAQVRDRARLAFAAVGTRLAVALQVLMPPHWQSDPITGSGAGAEA